jgi:alpha-L-rhamnosidase
MEPAEQELFTASGAKWIWPSSESDPGRVNQTLLFRREFTIDPLPESARLVISVDTNYTAWINGIFVGTGQFGDYPDRKTYDSLPVDHAMREGRNVVGILVHYCGVSHQSYIQGRPGLLFAMEIGAAVIGSGTTSDWRVSPAYRQGEMPRLTPQLPFTFEYDAALEDNWVLPAAYHGRGWQPIREADTHRLDDRPVRPRPLMKLSIQERVPAAVVAQGVFRRDAATDATVAELMSTDFLSARTTELLFTGIETAGRLSVTPVELRGGVRIRKPEKGTDGIYLVIDLGSNDCGYLDLELETEDPAVIDIAYGEHLDELRVRARIGNRNFASRYRCKVGRQRFTYCVTRWSARYLQLHISDFSHDFTLHYAGILPAPYPVGEKGNFDCSDRLLRRINEVAVRTLRICMHEHYEDTPWREQGLYANDARNQALCGFYCFGEYDFPKVSFDLLGQGLKEDGYLELCAPAEVPVTIPSFSLVWIIEVAETVLYSGDRAYAERMLPVVRQMIETYSFTLDDGLLPCPVGERYWHFYDWADGLSGDRGLEETRFDAPLNAFFCMALDAAALLGDWGGDELFSAACRDIAVMVRGAYHGTFWDERAGLYQTYAGSGGKPHVCELTQSLAVCGNLCDASTADELRSHLATPDNGLVETTLSQSIYKFESLLMNAEFYGPWVFEKIAEDWGHMLYHGATTFWETMKGGWDFFNAGSLSHAWSASPVYFFGAHLLGVRPTSPAFDTFTVAPVHGVVPRAAGRVPTPAGPIDVEWKERDGKIVGAVRHPPGTIPEISNDSGLLDFRTVETG